LQSACREAGRGNRARQAAGRGRRDLRHVGCASTRASQLDWRLRCHPESRRRKACALVDVQRLEREPIRLWPWLVRARRLSGSDNVKGDTNLGRSPTTNLVRTVGDNADLHGCAQLGQNGGRFWPGSELTQAGHKRRCTIWGKTDSLGRLGDEVVMRPIVTCQIRKAAVLAPPATAQRCAAGDLVVGRLRVEKPAEKVE
jgi:hypothetical protein